MKVFSFKNRGEERVLVISNVIGGMNNEASVHSVEVSDAKTTILLALTYIVPSSEGN